MSEADKQGNRPYLAYKPSGSQWIGEIPTHWKTTTIKRASHTGTGGTPPTEQQEYYGGGIPWVTSSELREQTIASTAETVSERAMSEITSLKLHPKGSVVVAMYGATIGRLGILGTSATLNQACCVCKASQHVSSKFLFHWLLAGKDNPISSGARRRTTKPQSRNNQRIPICLPPLEEQAAIVRYLDHVDQHIRAYVSAKERLIALLEEERHAVIHQAVTRGLDPNVKLKPSGVEWLGDVPEHWDVRRLKSFYTETEERSRTGLEELMSVSHKTGVTPRKQNVTMFLAETNDGYKVCRPGDIVVNTMWAYMAALGVSRQVGLVSPSYGVYRPIKQGIFNFEFVERYLGTEIYRTAYLMLSKGITESRLRLYADSFLESSGYCLHQKSKLPSSAHRQIHKGIDACHRPRPPADRTHGGIPDPVDCRRGHRENRRARSQTVNETQTPEPSNSNASAPAPEPGPSRTGSNTGIVYVLENPAMPGYIKLGRTDNLPQRMQSLFDTSVPVPFTCYYGGQGRRSGQGGEGIVEAFGDKRSHPRREFFTIDPHRQPQLSSWWKSRTSLTKHR